MICVTGLEKTLPELAARLQRFSGQMQEVRLDALGNIDESVFTLLKMHAPLIVTCRRVAQGGLFSGSDEEQHAILRRALAIQPAFIDLETSIPIEARREFEQEKKATRTITSLHRFEGPVDLQRDFQILAEEPGDLLKYAVMIEDAAELLPLLENELPGDRPVLRIGMGDAGFLSRALYTTFGSPWTYVAADPASGSAPGQLHAELFQQWSLDQLAGKNLYGLLGGPQVLHSPGTAVYNGMFRERSLSALYLPIVSTRPIETLPLLAQLGFSGISITMPAKITAMGLCDEVSSDALSAGAVNTISFSNNRIHGDNTDVSALREVLKRNSDDVLILGAGGVARAVLSVVGSRGILAARNREKADELAQEFSAKAIDWKHRGESEARTIVNATPLGMDGTSDPLPEKTTFAGRLVIDAVMIPEGTPLTRRAAASGAKVVDGYEMWVRQGALQMSRLLGQPVAVGDLQAQLDQMNPGVVHAR